MDSQSPAVIANSLTLSFSNETPVLENLSFSTQPGEITAILGPSGCGKSTLLRLIAKLIPPTSGSTKFTDNLAPEIAFIFQDPTLLPWKTVYENIALPLHLRNFDSAKIDPIVNQWMQLVGLSEVATFRPNELSGGMKMRVSLARALTLNPDLILFDEPFAALDAITRNRLNEEMISLHRRRKWSAFFVTHSITEATFLADKIIFLTASGKIHSIEPISLPINREAHLRSNPNFLNHIARFNEILFQITH